LSRIWDYFYSSSENKFIDIQNLDELDDFDKKAPLSGFGYGLPITKLYVDYFDGIITINSIKNIGTDVYLHFKY